MKFRQIIFLIFVFLIGITMLIASCKKVTEQTTVIQHDTVTVNQHDTVLINYTHINEYNTGDNSELVSKILVSNGAGWTYGEVVFSIKLQNLTEGDAIEAIADFELTNDLGYDVSAVSQISLTDSPLKLPDSSPLYEITEANGFDITPAMHHGHIVKVGTFICPFDFNEIYVNVCVNATSTLATSNDYLAAGGSFTNQDYGRLSVLVFKK